MSTITIEGTVTPSTFLPTGERRTVSRSPLIDKIIAKGFVKVVDEQPVPAAKAVESDPLAVPKRNGTREAWAAFLARLDPPVEFAESDGRDELINLYEDSEHYVAEDDDRG